MNVLIIGLGSIALKHIKAIRDLRPMAKIFALRSGKKSTNIDGVLNLKSWSEVPTEIDFALISNPSSEHYSTIEKAIDYTKILFIEKPSLISMRDTQSLISKLEENSISTYVAFNMRFHPVLMWLKGSLKSKRVIEAEIYCGSFLPDWRPGRDYREVYSSKESLGGGVHLDLIHEIDYSLWLFGTPKSIVHHRSKISDLEIESSDYAHYSMLYDQYAVNITLNYYRKKAKRSLEIVLEDDIWYADLINGQITDQEGNELLKTDEGINGTYFDQMDYFLKTIERNKVFQSDFKQSLSILETALGQGHES
jgi:predicted dehydrogenase